MPSSSPSLDEWVAAEYAKVRRLYEQLGLGDRTARGAALPQGSKPRILRKRDDTEPPPSVRGMSAASSPRMPAPSSDWARARCGGAMAEVKKPQ